MSINWQLQHRLRRDPYNLILFLAVSILLHGVAFLGGETYSRWSVRPNLPSNSEESTPIEYVEVPADQVALTPPPETKQRASTNAVAGGDARPDLPAATGGGGATSAAQPPSQSATIQSSSSPAQPSQPDISPQQQSQSTPLVDLQTSIAGNLNTGSAPSTSKPPRPEAQRQKASPAKRSVKPSQNAGDRSPQPASKSGQTRRPNANRSLPKSQKQGVDAREDSQLGTYITALRRQVDVQWRLPEKSDTSYKITVAFSVDRQGEMTALRVVKSSGSTLRDQAALKAVQEAAPFAPLPTGYRADRVNVEFEFKNIIERKSKSQSSQP